MYLEQETTPEGWWYAIAEAIGGRTVAELKAAMGLREFVGWQVYLGRKAQTQQIAGR
jgi:hypothetical protein